MRFAESAIDSLRGGTRMDSLDLVESAEAGVAEGGAGTAEELDGDEMQEGSGEL